MKIPLWIWIAVAIIAAAGIFIFVYQDKKDTQDFGSYTVRRELYRNIIETAGNVEAANEQFLQAAGDGTVERVFVHEGQTVRKGQVLLELDSTQQEYDLASHDFLMDQERINGSSKKLSLMEKQRGVLQKNIEDRKITARFDGVIAQFTAAPGDYVKAQDKLGLLIDRSYLKATVEIVETDASRLQVNQPIVFTFPAYPETVLDGYVVSYPAVGKITTRGVTVLETEIRIDNPPAEILPGYSFSAVITISADTNVLVLEREAVGYDKGQPYIERISSSGTERIPVVIENYGREFVKIIEGIKEGDLVKGLSAPGRFANSGGMVMSMSTSL